MPVNSILKGFESPSWNLARSACEKDDTSLLERAISTCSEKDDPDGLRHYIARHAIQNNAAKVLAYILDQGYNVQSLAPTVVAGDGRSKAILEILLAHGWDINYRNTQDSGPDAEPFLWHAVKDAELVHWCLEHDASVFARGQEPLSDAELTRSQRACGTVLERAAASATVSTFELLRSKGAPLGWQPLHLAVESAAIAAHVLMKRRSEKNDAENESHHAETESKEQAQAKIYTERLAMLRHLLDVVKLDVNALDHPVGRRPGGRLGPPICYVATLSGMHGMHVMREVTWLLLDRGADPSPGLEEAEASGHETFAGDVEAWKAQSGGGEGKSTRSGCNVQ